MKFDQTPGEGVEVRHEVLRVEREVCEVELSTRDFVRCEERERRGPGTLDL